MRRRREVGDPAYEILAVDALAERFDGETLAEGLVGERQRIGGLPTKLGERFTVHNRYGRHCPRCGEDLRRVFYESHDVTYCPVYQTGGKDLSVRRFSLIIRTPTH